jgi:uncharacterized damage-inducible protein DinB
MEIMTQFAFKSVLLACVVLAAQALAVAQDKKPAEAASGVLTEAERREVINYFEETRKAFLDSLQGLSEAQWKFKAAPDRWSIAEVAEHIAVSEDGIFTLVSRQILQTPAAPDKRESVKGKETMLRANITNRGSKFQAPEMLKPTNRWATRDELVKAFNASRDRTINYIKTTQDPLRVHFMPHPVLKDLDGYQWLFLISGHSLRHTEQIKEVKADAKYPKS